MRTVWFLFFALFIIAGGLAAMFNVFSLKIFLYLYLLLVFIFIIFTLFNLYHAWRFGSWSSVNFFVIFLYLLILAIIIFMSYNFINRVDWNQGVNINF